MIPQEGILKDVFDLVVGCNQVNDGIKTSLKVLICFPEFHKAVSRSMFQGSLNKRELEKNLSNLYMKMFREKRFGYFLSLRQILETEDGRNYIKNIK